MPRPKSEKPAMLAKSARQARYRERLRASGKPEASMVDIALAAAAARVFEIVAQENKRGRVLSAADAFRLILKDAKTDLVKDGHAETEANSKLWSRIRSYHIGTHQ